MNFKLEKSVTYNKSLKRRKRLQIAYINNELRRANDVADNVIK